MRPPSGNPDSGHRPAKAGCPRTIITSRPAFAGKDHIGSPVEMRRQGQRGGPILKWAGEWTSDSIDPPRPAKNVFRAAPDAPAPAVSSAADPENAFRGTIAGIPGPAADDSGASSMVRGFIEATIVDDWKRACAALITGFLAGDEESSQLAPRWAKGPRGSGRKFSAAGPERG